MLPLFYARGFHEPKQLHDEDAQCVPVSIFVARIFPPSASSFNDTTYRRFQLPFTGLLRFLGGEIIVGFVRVQAAPLQFFP